MRTRALLALTVALAALPSVAAATTPSPAPVVDGAVILTQPQLDQVWARTNAPNSLCSMIGTYFQVTFGDGGADDEAGDKARFVQAAPTFSALVADASVRMGGDLPPEYVTALAQWNSLFATVVADLRTAGLTDQQITDLALAEPLTLPASVDRATLDRATASMSLNPEAEFNAIRLGVSDLETFDTQATCPNVEPLTALIDFTKPRLVNKLTDSPNSVCGLFTVSLAFSFTSFDDTNPARRNEVAVGTAPSLLAMADDALATAPSDLPASVTASVQAIKDAVQPVVDALTAAGLSAEQQSAMVRSIVYADDGSGNDASAPTMPPDVNSAVQAVIASHGPAAVAALDAALGTIDGPELKNFFMSNCPALLGVGDLDT